jgi:hypothetical protein
MKQRASSTGVMYDSRHQALVSRSAGRQSIISGIL